MTTSPDLVALVAETVKLSARGPNLVGLCPFHREATPSFYVNPERGFFHCFGCKASGGAVAFVTKIEAMLKPTGS
jgi:DNA primase